MEQIAQLIAAHPYYALFPLAVVEGPLVSFIAGFLIARAILDPLPTLIILILGDFIPDLLCYGIGRFGASQPAVMRYAGKMGLREDQVRKLRRIWMRRPARSMFLAKLAYGLSIPALVSAGMVGLPPRTFAALALLVATLTRAVLMALGLYLGGYSRAVIDTLQVIEFAVASAIVAAVAYYFLSLRTRRHLLREAAPQANARSSHLRIAICTDIFLPQLSGVADSIECLADELRKAGNEVRIYAPRLPGACDDRYTVRFTSFLIPGSAGSLALVFPLGYLRDLRSFGPDIIHTQTFSTVGILAAYAAWRLDVPLVGTDHTFPAEYLHYVRFDFAPFRFLVRRAAALYYARCAFVTAPSQAMIDQLRAYGMSRPAKVISNPIRTDLFRPMPNRAQLKRKLGTGPRAVLLFGRIAKEKNWDVALDVFAAVTARRDAQLIVIGDGPYRGEFETKTRDRRLGERSRFLGALRGQQLVEAINACDIFLITSKFEAQSMATLQASACSLPIVGVKAGGLTEYVQDGITGYLAVPDDRDGLAARVIELLDDNDLRRQMGAKGRELAERFSPEVIAAQHLAGYAAALAPQPTPTGGGRP